MVPRFGSDSICGRSAGDITQKKGSALPGRLSLEQVLWQLEYDMLLSRVTSCMPDVFHAHQRQNQGMAPALSSLVPSSWWCKLLTCRPEGHHLRPLGVGNALPQRLWQEDLAHEADMDARGILVLGDHTVVGLWQAQQPQHLQSAIDKKCLQAQGPNSNSCHRHVHQERQQL